jgi:hypothetical protein
MRLINKLHQEVKTYLISKDHIQNVVIISRNMEAAAADRAIWNIYTVKFVDSQNLRVDK